MGTFAVIFLIAGWIFSVMYDLVWLLRAIRGHRIGSFQNFLAAAGIVFILWRILPQIGLDL